MSARTKSRPFRWLLVLFVLAAVLVAGLPTALAHLGLGPEMSLLPPRGEIQPLNDGRGIHYRLQGQGDPVVLIHGIPGLASDWRELANELAKRGKQVIAYDRVGYGHSTRGTPDDPSDFTFASHAADLASLLTAMKLEKVDVVGWSYGGGIAQAFAAQNPERVSKLVLLSSVGPESPRREPGEDPLGPAARLLGSSAGQSAVRWIASVPPLSWSLIKPGMVAAFSREDAIPAGWDTYAVAMIARPGAVASYSAEAERTDFNSLRPEAIEAPTLLLHGNDDQLNPFPVSEDLLARIPNAKLVPIFEGSHMLPVTHAKSLGETIDRFLGP